MNILCCIIIYLGILFGKDNCEEPGCSRFQYDEKMLEKLIRFEIGMDTMRQEMKQLRKMVNDGLNLLQTERIQFKQDINAMKPGTGAVFVRWGRNSCSATSEMVYKGFIGGKKYSSTGSGTNHLCLPSDPTWSNHVDGNSDSSYRGWLYGTEIHTVDSDHIFNYAVHNQDMPCAVCRTQKSTSVMIPARNDCYPGWTLEYNGYIMSNQNDHPASYDYMCIDNQPEFLQHGGTDDSEHILYLVEARCGSLPCPPYVHGRELNCVVCSK